MPSGFYKAQPIPLCKQIVQPVCHSTEGSFLQEFEGKSIGGVSGNWTDSIFRTMQPESGGVNTGDCSGKTVQHTVGFLKIIFPYCYRSYCTGCDTYKDEKQRRPPIEEMDGEQMQDLRRCSFYV